MPRRKGGSSTKNSATSVLSQWRSLSHRLPHALSGADVSDRLGIARRLQGSLRGLQNCDVVSAGRCGGLLGKVCRVCWHVAQALQRSSSAGTRCGLRARVHSADTLLERGGLWVLWVGWRSLQVHRFCPSKQAYSGVFLRSAAATTTCCARIGVSRGQHACSCIEQSHLAHSPGTARLSAESSQPCPAPSVESHCQPQQLS
jgi:hypothetical protein